jgi:dipeptidyl aminopeptidase/acylaminoacyl peptidase
MPARGGEAHKFTDLPGGVSDFDFAPDSKRLALIAMDPESEPGATKPKHPAPIVIDRYQFKDDDAGYLGARHKHLYLYDLARSKAELLTPGAHDEQLPAWSPDGKHIAYVTKRGDDPDRNLNFDIWLIEPRVGANERQLTTFAGSDLDPYWESRPSWSPDSKRIAYLQGGEDRDIYYAPWQLAVIDVATGKSTLPAPIDRCFYKPRFSADGKSVVALIERNLVTNAARIELASGKVTTLDPGQRFDADFDVSRGGRVVVLGGTDTRPYGISAVEPKALRRLADHNAFLDAKTLSPAEEIRFESMDGTEIEALLVKPPGFEPGKKYPAVLRLHGGPVYQFSHEFLPDFQALAGAGYVVIGPNPRGSSGRGFEFARAIRADWGHKDVEDVLAAVDHVASLGMIDTGRLGVGGRSYGGILTNYVIASDKRFKAAVSGAGSANALGMYGHDMYTREVELELGQPWSNREAYDRVSYAFLHADRIVTPTQFYCAEKDFNVPCQGSEQMYQALRSQNVPTQFVIYPGEHHAMAVPSYLRDRMERALGWYAKYLGTGAGTPVSAGAGRDSR